MAKTDNLNVRLNAQANLTNIDSIKKDLEKVMSGISLNKSVEGNLNKLIDRMEILEKAFDNISKKDVFNEKDIQAVNKKTQELEATMREVSSIMESISMEDIIKSSEQYKKLMKEINEETQKLKKGFKDSTGLDYDKEIKGIKNLEANIKELKRAKEELQKTGVDAEYHRLLDNQNTKLDEQRKKLEGLKTLQAEIVAYQNQMAKGKGFNSYADLQKVATTRTNKADFISKGMADAEIQEIQRLNAEYDKFEEQLKRIDNYKNQASKTRGIKKLSEQLGIDATTTAELDKIIQKMRELTETTAHVNVNQNNGLKVQLNEQYAALVRARTAAKEYVDEIMRGANARVAMSGLTGAKTVSGLGNDVANVNALIAALSSDDATDNLLTQAQQGNTNAISALDTQLTSMENIFTTLVNTMKLLYGIEGQERDFLNETANSLKSIDQDTTELITNTYSNSQVKELEEKGYSQEMIKAIAAGEYNLKKAMAEEGFNFRETNTKGILDDDILDLVTRYDNYKKQAYNTGPNGNPDLSKLSNLDKADFEATVQLLKEKIDGSLVLLGNMIKDYSNQAKAFQSSINNTKEQIKKIEETKNSNNGQTNSFDKGYTSGQEHINALKDTITQDEARMQATLESLKGIRKELEAMVALKEQLRPILDDPINENIDVGKGVATMTNAGLINIQLEDAEKKNIAINEELKERAEALKTERAEQEKNNKELKNQIEITEELKQKIKGTSQNLLAQSKNYEHSSIMAKTFGETIGQIGTTVGTYISLNYIFNQIFMTIRKGIGTIKEMDKSITQIGIVTNKTSQEVWSSFSIYNTQAKRLNTTTTQLLEATKLYYQQGLNTAEVNQMVEATAIAAALGEVEMADAANTLTSIMNGYNIEATKAMEVTDKISAVGADSAADFGELSSAIEKVASSAATAGIDLDHLLGYLGKMIEVTREAPTNIGSAMKSIVSRMAELKEDPTKALEDGTDVSKVQTALRTVGIELFDTQGQMRALDDVIDELGGKWNSLSRNSQAYIATIIAGNRQQSRFLALMNDYDRTMELVASSTDSAGRSSKQFRNYTTGLEASLNKVKAEAEGFYASLSSGNNALKFAYDFFADLLKIVNDLGPALTFAGAGVATFTTKMLLNMNKLKQDKTLNNISERIAKQIETDSWKNTAKINKTSIFGSTKQTGNPNTKWGKTINWFERTFSTGNLFEKINSGKIKELNNLISVYDEKIDSTVTSLDDFVEISNLQKKAINEIATSNKIGVKQATGMYIAQEKQKIGTKALTAEMWANVAAQAAMTIGITLIIGAAVKLISYLSDVNAGLRKQVEQAGEIAQKAQEEVSAIEILVNKYEKLNKKLELTTEEKEELRNVTDELVKQFPDLLTGLDSEGNAYIKNANALKDYLKQKKLEAAQKEKEYNEKKLRLGQTFIGRNEKQNYGYGTNPENGYTPEHTEKIQKLNSSVEDVGFWDWDTFIGDEIFLETIDSKTGVPNLAEKFSSPAQLAEAIQQGNIVNLDKALDEIKKSNWSEDTKQKLEEVINNYKEATEAGAKGLQEIQSNLARNNREIAIGNKNLTDEQETFVKSLTETFAQNFITTETNNFKNDEVKVKKWFEENQSKISDNLVNIISRAATGSSAKKIKEAYDNYIKTQTEGLSTNEQDKARKELFNLLKNSAETSEEKELLIQFYESQIQAQQGLLEDSVRQALQSLGVNEGDNNYENLKDKLTNFFKSQNSTIREKITDSINAVMNNDDLFGGDTNKRNEFAQKMVGAISAISNDENIGELFTKELNELDINNAVDVKAWHDKWNGQLMTFAAKVGMTPEEIKEWIERIIPNPGSIIEDVTKQLAKDMTDMQSINGQKFQDLFDGDYDISSAIEDGFNLGQGTVVGDKFLVNTNVVIDKMDEANDALKEHIEALKIGALEQGQDAIEQIEEIKSQISAIELKAKGENRNLSSTEQTKINHLKDSLREQQKIVKESSQELDNANRLNDTLNEQLRKRKLLASQNVFNDYNSGVNQQISSLKDLAGAYEDIKEGELTQLDIVEMIANNSDMLTAVYVNERGELALNKNALEDLAKTKIKTAITDGEVKIKQLEALRAMVDANKWYTEDTRKKMEEKVGINEDLEKDDKELGENTEVTLENIAKIWEDWVNELKNKISPKFGGWLNNMLTAVTDFGTKVGSSLGKVWDSFTGFFKNDEDSGWLKGDGLFPHNKFGLPNKRPEIGPINEKPIVVKIDEDVNTDIEDFGSDIKTEGAISGAEYIENIDKQIAEIKALNGALQKMYDNGSILDSINNMKGKKDKEKFKAYMEYFEKFYNYIKQIQNLEAKINRLREKRNIIDANKNYYIKDLQKENELLAQQAVIYNQYIRAQKDYLKGLQNQISSTYGDLAYFTDEGLLQLKVSEVWISSESQEERIKEFQRLMEEYESQYETMQDNETKLYEIQSTQLSNITAMYDKLLQRLADVREHLEFLQSISEHKITMAYGDLETLDLLNDKLLTTIDLWSNAADTVGNLEKDMELIRAEVEGSNLGQFLQWDEDLGQYRITDAFYDDLVKQDWESMGANWSEVTTWVTKTAKESEEVARSWREAKEQLMSAEETLKQIVEDRLSKIEELIGGWNEDINNIFDNVKKLVDLMGTKIDLFGGTTEDYQAQYEGLIAQAALARVTIEELSKSQKKTFDELVALGGEYVAVTAAGVEINEKAIRESTTLTDAQKAKLIELITTYKLQEEQIENLKDTELEALQQIIQMEEEKRQARIDTLQQIHDAMKEADQKEVDELQKKYDEMERLDTEYYNALKQKIEDARNARDINQQKIQTDQMRAQIAVLQRDNTSQYNKQLIDLQKQLNEQLQQQADDEINRELERIEREQQERQEDRELQIRQMENLIEFKDENGVYWQEAEAMFESGIENVKSFLATEMMAADESKIEKLKNIEDMQKQTNLAFVEFSNTDFNNLVNEEQAIHGILGQMARAFTENGAVTIVDGNITASIGGLKVDVTKAIEGMNSSLGEVGRSLIGEGGNTISGLLKQNIEGINKSIIAIDNTKNDLYDLLNQILRAITGKDNNNKPSGGTGIVNSGGSGGGSGSGGNSGSGSGSGNSGSGAGNGGELKIGSKVRVKPKQTWYSSSYKGDPTGPTTPYANEDLYIVNAKNGMYAVGKNRSVSSALGWLYKKDLVGYKNGGYVDFTGPTMVHGTQSKPEAFLNARQTALFEELRDMLVGFNYERRVSSERLLNKLDQISVDSVNVNVQEVADMGMLIRDSIEQMKKEVINSIDRQTAMKVRRR